MKCASCGMESWNDFCPYCGSKLKVEQSTAASTFEQNIPVPPPQQNLTVPQLQVMAACMPKRKSQFIKDFGFIYSA